MKCPYCEKEAEIIENDGNYWIKCSEDAPFNDVEEDETGFKYDSGHYPRRHCYKVKTFKGKDETFPYSEAINLLHPNDYMRWVATRFLSAKKIYDELQHREEGKTDYLSRMDVMAILDILLSS